MSSAAMTYVWERSAATGTDRLVLLALADEAGPSGEVLPSLKRIARKANIAVPVMWEAIRNLCEAGELERLRSGYAIPVDAP